MDDRSDIMDQGTPNHTQNDQSNFSTNFQQKHEQTSQTTHFSTNDGQNFASNIVQREKIIQNPLELQKNEVNQNFDGNKEENMQSYENSFQILQQKGKLSSSKIVDVMNGLQVIQATLTKVIYRNFHNRLITFYIQSLKEQQRKIRQTKQIEIKILKQQSWPFKELFYKKYRTQNEQLMFQFISMCAQKIQATFKGYITFKRHKKAFKKIQQFKRKLGSIIIGWKTWKVYNCKKIVQLRKTVSDLTHQIDREIENPNIDRLKKMKKLQYLNANQEIAKESFLKSFKQLTQSGTWIYEVDRFFKVPIKKGHSNKVTEPYYQNYQAHNQTKNEQKNGNENDVTSVKVQKGRKRQFQGPTKRISKKQNNPTTQNIAANHQSQVSGNLNHQKSVNSVNYQSSGAQQRPIVAKGKYEICDQDIKSAQNQFLKINQPIKNIDNQFDQYTEQPAEARVNKFKDDEKKKLIKRQKYDPRKAIEEEKKRLLEQKQKKLQKANQPTSTTSLQSQNQANKQNRADQQKKTTRKTPNKIKKQQAPRRQLQSPKEQNKDKTVEKVKQQSKLTKKGDNSKSVKSIINKKKVQSKVDCWTKKQPSSSQNISTDQSSYKSKYLMNLKEKNQSKNAKESEEPVNIRKIQQFSQYSKVLKNLQRNISKDQEIQQREQHQQNAVEGHPTELQGQQQTYQSSYLKKLVQERERGSFSYGNQRGIQKKIMQKVSSRKQSAMIQKVQQLNDNVRRLSQNRSSLSNLKNMSQERKAVLHKHAETQLAKKKEQVYRPVQSLEQVYSSQYTDRFNNLKNKLNMLQSNRYIQRDDSIPVILQDSKFIKKIYKDHCFSSLYWPQVRTMETNFLDYIKFTIPNS